METKTLRNAGASLWGGTRSHNFHETSKSTSDSLKETYDSYSNLSGRPPPNREELRYEEALKARDSVIFLLTQLGLTINWEKSVLEPTQKVEYLGMVLDTRDDANIPSITENTKIEKHLPGNIKGTNALPKAPVNNNRETV